MVHWMAPHAPISAPLLLLTPLVRHDDQRPSLGSPGSCCRPSTAPIGLSLTGAAGEV